MTRMSQQWVELALVPKWKRKNRRRLLHLVTFPLAESQLAYRLQDQAPDTCWTNREELQILCSGLREVIPAGHRLGLQLYLSTVPPCPSLWRQPSSPSFGDRPPQREIVLFTVALFYITGIMGFGQFNSICEKTPLPLCLLVGPASSISGATGIVSNCYARNIEVANTMIFQGADSFMHIIALGMTVIMILHIRSKFTAVGSSDMPWMKR